MADRKLCICHAVNDVLKGEVFIVGGVLWCRSFEK